MLPSFWQLSRLHWPPLSRQIPIRIRARIYLRRLTVTAILTRTRVVTPVDRGGGGGILMTPARLHHLLVEGDILMTLARLLPLLEGGDTVRNRARLRRRHLIEGGIRMTLARLHLLRVKGSILIAHVRLRFLRVEEDTLMTLVPRPHLLVEGTLMTLDPHLPLRVEGGTRTTLVPRLHLPDDDDLVPVQRYGKKE